jgi:hypothetical protein
MAPVKSLASSRSIAREAAGLRLNGGRVMAPRRRATAASIAPVRTWYRSRSRCSSTEAGSMSSAFCQHSTAFAGRSVSA